MKERFETCRSWETALAIAQPVPGFRMSLHAQGRIKSICVKSHNDALRGVRLVDRESIDLFMESLHEVVPRI